MNWWRIYLKNIAKPLSIRKIDYSVNPLFAIVFGQTPSLEEIKNLLNLDMAQFVK